MLGLMGVLTHVHKLKRKTPDVQQISDEARDDILWKTADKPSKTVFSKHTESQLVWLRL